MFFEIPFCGSKTTAMGMGESGAGYTLYTQESAPSAKSQLMKGLIHTVSGVSNTSWPHKSGHS